MADETVFQLRANAGTFDKTIEEAINLYNLFKSPDLEKWFEQWEQGFPTAINERGAGNYNINLWRPDSTKRPRLRIWTSKEQQVQLGYGVYEYWKDRSVEAESVIFAGTEAQVINQIIQYEYEGGGSATSSLKGKGFLPKVGGQPFILLNFYEEKQTGKYRYAGEKIIRIMNNSDNPDSDLPLISNADITGYARRIISAFSGFIWRKGRECVSYEGRVPKQSGIDGWAYVRSEADGLALFAKLAEVVQKPLDSRFIKHSKTKDEAGAYPTNPAPVTVLGKPHTPPEKRPLVDVKFTSATITLPYLGKELPLVKGSTLLFLD